MYLKFRTLFLKSCWVGYHENLMYRYHVLWGNAYSGCFTDGATPRSALYCRHFPLECDLLSSNAYSGCFTDGINGKESILTPWYIKSIKWTKPSLWDNVTDLICSCASQLLWVCWWYTVKSKSTNKKSCNTQEDSLLVDLGFIVGDFIQAAHTHECTK